MSDPIAYALEKTQAEGVSPYVRPYVMEALIRHHSRAEKVFEAFQASDEERGRVRELLAKPGVWEAS